MLEAARAEHEQCMEEAQLLKTAADSATTELEALKEKAAALVQLALGFWWDSVKRTRTLEPSKSPSKLSLGRFGDIVKGPLIRATEGNSITHMPLQPGSTYAHLTQAMTDAYHECRLSGEPDQELDLGSHDAMKPKIGHHWARRKADQVARDTAEATDTDKETIDEALGWNQKEAKRESQLHYAGSTNILKLARVTMML